MKIKHSRSIWKTVALSAAALLVAAGCESPQESGTAQVPINVLLKPAGISAAALSPTVNDLCESAALPEYVRFRFTDVNGEQALERYYEGLLTEEDLANTGGFVKTPDDLPYREIVYVNPYIDPLPYEGNAEVVGSLFEQSSSGLSGVFLLPKTRLRIEFTAWTRPAIEDGIYSVTPQFCQGETDIEITGDDEVTIEGNRAETAEVDVSVRMNGNTDGPAPFAYFALVDFDTGYGFPVRTIADDEFVDPYSNFSVDNANVIPEVPVGRDYTFVAWHPGRYPYGGNGGFITEIQNTGKYEVDEIDDLTTEGGSASVNINLSQDQPLIFFGIDEDAPRGIPTVAISADDRSKSASDEAERAEKFKGALDVIGAIKICNLADGDEYNAGYSINDYDCATGNLAEPMLTPPEMAFVSGAYGYEYSSNSGFALERTEALADKDFFISEEGLTITANATYGYVSIPVPDPDRSSGRGLDTNVIQPDWGVGLARSFCVYTKYVAGIEAKFTSARLFDDPSSKISEANLYQSQDSAVKNGLCRADSESATILNPGISLRNGVFFQTRRNLAPANFTGTFNNNDSNNFGFTVPPGFDVIIVPEPGDGQRPHFDPPAIFCDDGACFGEALCSFAAGQEMRAYSVGPNEVPSLEFLSLTVGVGSEDACF